MAQEQATASQEKPQETTVAHEQATTSQEKPQEQETEAVQVAQPQEQRAVTVTRTPRSTLAVSMLESPFALMRRLMDDMDRVFSGGGFGPSAIFASPIAPLETMGPGFWVPAIETFERDGKLVLRADLPGLRCEDVNVEIVGDELVVSGERKHEEKRAAGGRLYSERRYGSFERRLSLPEGIDRESIEASFDNGVLEVSLPVPERAGRKIEVKSRAAKTEEGGQVGSIH